MTGQVFLSNLRNCLSGRMSPAEMENHISYYENYINTQVRMGRTEEDVLRDLDPALIAKSILAAADAKMEQSEEEADMENRESFGTNAIRVVMNWPTWLKVTAGVLVVGVALTIIFKILLMLMPLILAFIVVVFIYNYIQRRR